MEMFSILTVGGGHRTVHSCQNSAAMKQIDPGSNRNIKTRYEA